MTYRGSGHPPAEGNAKLRRLLCKMQDLVGIEVLVLFGFTRRPEDFQLVDLGTDAQSEFQRPAVG